MPIFRRTGALVLFPCARRLPTAKMLVHRFQEGRDMYEAFFQFQSRPFPAAPIVGNYFPAQSIESARQNLIRSIERSEGPGLIIGPAGVGKTLLLRVLADHFRANLRPVFLSASRVTTRKALLQNILYELDLPYRALDEGELRLSLIDAVRRNEQLPQGLLLLIDEAHTLPMRLLDEARLITNIAVDGQPRVRLVLAGGPSLEERFAHPKLDSFNQRIAARCYLQAFTRDESQEYIRAELSWAGVDPDAVFAADSVRAVMQATDGIPRLINQICDHALVMAHAAGVRRVEASLIQEAWSDLQQLPPPWNPTRSAPAATANSTVIEFGELGDDGHADDRQAEGLEPTEHFQPPTGETCVAQNDCPCVTEPVEPDLNDFAAMFQTDTLVIGGSCPGFETEWVNCQEPLPEIAVPEVREEDPFNEAFEEEVVVIDRHTAREVDGLRGRPRVSSSEGRELALLLGISRSSAPTEPTLTVVVESGESLSPAIQADLAPLSPAAATVEAPSQSAFEFSTLQDLPEIDSTTDLTDEFPEITSGQEDQIDLDFEEEVQCVPLPWTRGTLGDDRDIIIVEEDAQPEFVMTASDDESPRRTEYRDLFAQLRRVSN